MNRRSFLGSSIAALGGSLLVGKLETKQLPVEKEVEEAKSSVRIDEYGNFIFPAFFTVFIDGKEAFRMLVGDTVTVERDCQVSAFNGFESKPSINTRLFTGDSLTIHG